MEKPAGRKLRRRGNSAERRLPRPVEVSPSTLTFEARVPRTIGAAAARIVPADEVRRPESSAILLWMLERSPPKSIFRTVPPACEVVLATEEPPPAAAPIALRAL